VISSLLYTINVLAAFIPTEVTDTLCARYWEWASTVHPPLLAGRVSNGSGKPASSPGLDNKNGSDQCQTRPNTIPTNTWRANPGHEPVYLQVLPGLGRHVSSNLQFCVLGFTFMVIIWYATVNREILSSVQQRLFLMYWPPYWLTRITTCTLQHPENERQQCHNDCWSCILGNLGGATGLI